jgi:DUF971 family protein
MTPERLEVCDGGRLLRLVWPGCRSAGARRARIGNWAPKLGDVRIAALHPVGNYAVNIAFSYGQDRRGE